MLARSIKTTLPPTHNARPAGCVCLAQQCPHLHSDHLNQMDHDNVQYLICYQYRTRHNDSLAQFSKPSTNMTTSTARKETATGCLRRGGLQTPRRCTQSQSSSCWRWPAARFWCACWAMPQQQQRATIARAHPSARLPTWTQLRLSPAMMALLPTCWCWALAAAEQLSSSAVATTCWSPRTACT